MYDELIKRLKEDKSWVEQGTTETEHEIAKHIQQAADAIEEMSRLNAEITKRELKLRMEKPRWIPVTERLPGTDDDVVVAFKNSKDGEWWYRIDNFVDGQFCYNSAFNRHVEYWMPLPEPPKEG